MGLTLAMTGTQQLLRSSLVLLRVRFDQQSQAQFLLARDATIR